MVNPAVPLDLTRPLIFQSVNTCVNSERSWGHMLLALLTTIVSHIREVQLSHQIRSGVTLKGQIHSTLNRCDLCRKVLWSGTSEQP